VDETRLVEKSFHVTKLKLLEVFPLYPFLYGRDGVRVVEVGGNVGLWCEAFWDVFGDRIADYHAFEPMPANLARFEERLRDHMPDAKVVLHPQCVGDTTGTVTIHYDNPVTTLASVPVEKMEFRGNVIDNRHSMAVPQVRLDDAADGHVDLVKIDTEGYEWNVLHGAEGLIRDGLIDNIYFEFGAHQGHLGQSFRQFFDFLTGYGYRIFRQTVSRNYFGLNEIRRCGEQFEDFSSMWMILASRTGVPDDYQGPRVVGRIN
jgi:FkbM family methyltransferase